MKQNIFSLLVLSAMAIRSLATDIVIKKDTLQIRNAFYQRQFVFDKKGFHTVSYKDIITNSEYSDSLSKEFSFSINNKEVNGNGYFFKYAGYSAENISATDQLIKISLKGIQPISAGIAVTLFYYVYDDLPAIRKGIEIQNHSGKEISISNLDIENLDLMLVSQYMTEIYSNYGTNLHRIPYKGDYYDPALLVWSAERGAGFILGNEAPSVLKKINVHATGHQVSIGLKHNDEAYPFKKILANGEILNGPKTFISFYNGNKWQDAFEGYFAKFIRSKIGFRLAERPKKFYMLYNTWRPFRTNISDSLIRQTADALEGSATDILILDDGWDTHYNDFNPDKNKFPNGLKPVCDYIRSKNMRPGLWIPIQIVKRKSRVFIEHPEWTVRGKNGEPVNLHASEQDDNVSMSLCTPYYNYLLNNVVKTVRENGIAYVKLDLAIANSAYVPDENQSGDYSAKGKTGFKDHDGSYWAMYEKTIQFLDALHAACPDLLVDCTFEVWGRYNIVDYALIQHADFDWITNFEKDPPDGPISIRQMAAERARVIPPSAMLIGNQLMFVNNYQYSYLSLATTQPIMVGDVRNMNQEAKNWYKKMNGWFREMDRKYQFPLFYQASDVFDKATLSNWDGVYKFNMEKDGGVLFFFRNGSKDKQRIFRVHVVNENSTYSLYSAITGKQYGNFTGKQLKENGIAIELNDEYSTEVLGIDKF
jgi:alpha-galactosidase